MASEAEAAERDGLSLALALDGGLDDNSDASNNDDGDLDDYSDVSDEDEGGQRKVPLVHINSVQQAG